MFGRMPNTIIPLGLLAAASGARSMTGIAALRPNGIAPVLAGGELIADKIPNVPNRNEGLALAGRVAVGALIGAIVAHRTERNPLALAFAGGMIAFASAHATYRMRHALSERLPDTAAALVEDAIVIGAATAGAALLKDQVPDPDPRV
jgi:uncharacterized membrane protein